jgi:hypothetical protein
MRSGQGSSSRKRIGPAQGNTNPHLKGAGGHPWDIRARPDLFALTSPAGRARAERDATIQSVATTNPVLSVKIHGLVTNA